MKVLVVKRENSCYPFVEEQIACLESKGIECKCFLIRGKGWKSYVQSFARYRKEIRDWKPDIVHAHYGISGLFANMQRSVPVITTYHGSDINNSSVRKLSKLTQRLSAYNLFVSQALADLMPKRDNSSVLPCGVIASFFEEMNKKKARQKLGLPMNEKLVLFSSTYRWPVKNPALAQQAMALVYPAKLIEFDGYTREESALLMRAVDVCLMTSFTEGSPQFIKEAMASGCPIVTTPVGDTKMVIDEMEGCYFTSYEVEDCARQIKEALDYAEQNDRTNGRQRILTLQLDNNTITDKLIAIYQSIKK